MNRLSCFLIAAATLAWSHVGRAAEEPIDLRVLYLANAGSERADAYVDFLKQQFVTVDTADRDKFNVEAADEFDVVILDWSQSDTGPADVQSPLGERQQWSTPTVLLGSAGLLLAGPWEIMGGAG